MFIFIFVKKRLYFIHAVPIKDGLKSFLSKQAEMQHNRNRTEDFQNIKLPGKNKKPGVTNEALKIHKTETEIRIMSQKFGTIKKIIL